MIVPRRRMATQMRDRFNRSAELDELIRSIETARNTFITLETAPEAAVSAKAVEPAERAQQSPDSDSA